MSLTSDQIAHRQLTNLSVINFVAHFEGDHRALQQRSGDGSVHESKH